MNEDRRISKNFATTDIRKFMSLLVINYKKHKTRNKKLFVFIPQYVSCVINLLDKLYYV
jgi:hypothetical protein